MTRLNSVQPVGEFVKDAVETAQRFFVPPLRGLTLFLELVQTMCLMFEKADLQFENADFKLSETKPFSWRRNLPPLEAKKTVFNYVATYNDFERRFARFLDKAPDVARFASLGTTEQGESGTQFRVDYLKQSGAIGFYHPDWVVVQKTNADEVNWIIETKGRVWEGTTAKDDAIKDWCERVSDATGATWRYVRINQTQFDARKPTILEEVAPGD